MSDSGAGGNAASQLDGLESADKNVRARTALEIGKLADASATRALIEALRTEADSFVAENLTWALVRLSPAPLEPLLQLLRHGSPLARHRAAHVLSKIADPSTFDALVAALADDDLTVLSKVVFALGRLADPRAIPPLAPLLANRSRDLQSTLAAVLAGFGDSALPCLLDTLRSQDAHGREHAAYVVGQIGGESSVLALSEVSATSAGKCASPPPTRSVRSAAGARATRCAACSTTSTHACAASLHGSQTGMTLRAVKITRSAGSSK